MSISEDQFSGNVESAMVDSPCDCTLDLLAKSRKHGISMPGLTLKAFPSGKVAAGVGTYHMPKLVGGKPSLGMVYFNYCPWCGKPLMDKKGKRNEII